MGCVHDDENKRALIDTLRHVCVYIYVHLLLICVSRFLLVPWNHCVQCDNSGGSAEDASAAGASQWEQHCNGNGSIPTPTLHQFLRRDLPTNETDT